MIARAKKQCGSSLATLRSTTNQWGTLITWLYSLLNRKPGNNFN